MPSNKISTEPTGENSTEPTEDNSTEISFKYDSTKSWIENNQRLYQLFVETYDIDEMSKMERMQSYNKFRKEQIKKGNMRVKPENRPRHRKRPIAALSWNTNEHGIKSNWKLTGEPGKVIKDSNYGISGFTPMPGKQETVESPKKPKQTNYDAPNSVFAWLNHTSKGGLKKKKKTNKRRNKTNKRRNKRKQTKKRRRNT